MTCKSGEQATWCHRGPAGIQKMEAANRAMSRSTLARFLFVLAAAALLAAAWQFGAKKLLARRDASA